jgi:hypothetical protein
MTRRESLFAIAALTSAAAVFSRARPTTPAVVMTAGRAMVVATAQAMGLSGWWADWLVWVSKGEAGWRVTAHNASPGERAAAGKAYDRLVKEGRWPCPLQRSSYAIGSGGLYGQLAPLTIHFGDALGMGCDPIAIWRDPIAGTRCHLEQVRGTLAILRSKTGGKGTALQLRALYGLPTRNPATVDTPQRRAQYSATLRRAGIDPVFLDSIVPQLPGG